MTDKTETSEQDQQTPETPQEAVEAPETPQDAPEVTSGPESDQDAAQAQEDAQDARTPNAEARKYRLRLRETEAELTAAREQIEGLQDQLMQDVLAGDFHLIPATGNRAVDGNGQPKAQAMRLRDPDDLFSVGGVDRGALFNDDGTLDTVKLSAAVQQLHSQRPELFTGRPGAVSTIGKTPEAPTPARTWSNVLSGD